MHMKRPKESLKPTREVEEVILHSQEELKKTNLSLSIKNTRKRRNILLSHEKSQIITSEKKEEDFLN